MIKVVCALVFALAVFGPGHAWAQKQTRVGVVADGPSDTYARFDAALKAALKELGSQGLTFEFSEAKTKVCDFTVACIQQALDAQLTDPELDVVVTAGALGSNLVVQRENLPKPVLAPAVFDLSLHNLPKRVQRKNLSYVVWAPDWERDLKAFRRIVGFKKLAVVLDKRMVEAVPGLAASVEKALSTVGVSASVVPMEDSAKAVIDALPAGVDAVYVGPLHRFGEQELQKLAHGLRQKRLPSFTFAGDRGVERGFLAGIGSQDDLLQLARLSALNLRGLIMAQPPDTLLTAFVQSEELALNAEVARAIGVTPDNNVLLDVRMLGASRAKAADRPFSLADAVREALKTNLALAASREGLLATAEEIKLARAGLLPQLGVGVGGRWIDADRTLLYGAERSVSWSAQLRQSLYDERSWGTFTTQQHLQRAREQEQQAFQLDVALAVALAYLDLLRAETGVEVQNQNLELSRSNLALARVREKVGVGGREEVFRWEAQLASDQNRLVRDVALLRSAKVELNTLLNRPSERGIVTKELSIDDPTLLPEEAKLKQYLVNPALFAVLSDFMTQESQRLAPELNSLDASIAATERSITAEKRSYFLPSIVANAGVEHRFYEDGEGTDPVPIAGVETPDSVDWRVGVVASLPLLEGGGHNAELRRQERQRGQLTLQKKSAAREIERQLRVSLYRANATLAAIELTRAEAAAATKNLEVVTDKYREGTAAIIQLLDAQNQAVVAQLDAANAAFDFLAQLMRVERAMGRFSFLVDADKTRDFFRRLDDFSRRSAQRTGGTE